MKVSRRMDLGSRGIRDLTISHRPVVFAPCLNDISSLPPFYPMDGRDQREIMFGRVSREQSRFLWMASSLADNFVFGEFCGKEVDRLRFGRDAANLTFR